jgi:hypothetical protein
LEPSADGSAPRVWLAKPFTSQTLLQHVRAVLDA